MTATEQHADNSVETVRELATRYSKAWNDHDIEAIMAMHAPESAFHLHVHPYPEANTHEAIRAQFEGFFQAMPDMTFETIRLEAREGLFVHEWLLTCTLAEPFQIGKAPASQMARRFASRASTSSRASVGWSSARTATSTRPASSFSSLSPTDRVQPAVSGGGRTMPRAGGRRAARPFEPGGRAQRVHRQRSTVTAKTASARASLRPRRARAAGCLRRAPPGGART